MTQSVVVDFKHAGGLVPTLWQQQVARIVPCLDQILNREYATRNLVKWTGLGASGLSGQRAVRHVVTVLKFVLGCAMTPTPRLVEWRVLDQRRKRNTVGNEIAVIFRTWISGVLLTQIIHPQCQKL